MKGLPVANILSPFNAALNETVCMQAQLVAELHADKHASQRVIEPDGRARPC